MIGVLAAYHRALVEAPEPSLRGRIMDHLIHCAPEKLSSRRLATAMGIRGKKGMTRLRVTLQRLAMEGWGATGAVARRASALEAQLRPLGGAAGARRLCGRQIGKWEGVGHDRLRIERSGRAGVHLVYSVVERIL